MSVPIQLKLFFLNLIAHLPFVEKSYRESVQVLNERHKNIKRADSCIEEPEPVEEPKPHKNKYVSEGKVDHGLSASDAATCSLLSGVGRASSGGYGGGAWGGGYGSSGGTLGGICNSSSPLWGCEKESQRISQAQANQRDCLSNHRMEKIDQACCDHMLMDSGGFGGPYSLRSHLHDLRVMELKMEKKQIDLNTALIAGMPYGGGLGGGGYV